MRYTSLLQCELNYMPHVCTHPAESWKVMEFETPNFQAWKVSEIDQRPGNFAFPRSSYKKSYKIILLVTYQLLKGQHSTFIADHNIALMMILSGLLLSDHGTLNCISTFEPLLFIEYFKF